MTPEHFNRYIFMVRRHRFLSQSDETQLRFLADDINVNEFGVYMHGLEEISVDAQQTSAHISIVQGRNSQWFFGLNWEVEVNDFKGISFGPHISQAIDGESSNSRVMVLRRCINLLRQYASDDLQEYPEVKHEFFRKLDLFCLKAFIGIRRGHRLVKVR